MAARGKVTSLSSIFPAEEARKASQRVQDTITEKRKEIDTVRSFIADNTNIINLVQRLPDELQHQIMVPFGKAAFFPGRLVHTNEFMVLLGEGYYAERTAKQTVDILKRRGKTLESQVDSLKAVIKDLKTEASFFDRTAAEAAEGLVEITEEYADEDSVETHRISGVQKSDGPVPRTSGEDSRMKAVDDEEYARIMSRFDELEREELEAGDTEEPEPWTSEEDRGAKIDHDEEYARIMSRFDELEREELEAEGTEECEDDGKVDSEEDDDENGDGQGPEDDENTDTEESEVDEDGDTEVIEDDEHDESLDNLVTASKEQAKARLHAKEVFHVTPALPDGGDTLSLGNLSSGSRNRGESSHGKALMEEEVSKLSEKGYVPPSILKSNLTSTPSFKKVSFQIPESSGSNQIVGSVTQRSQSLKASAQKPKPDDGSGPSRPNADSLKASAQKPKPDDGSGPSRPNADSLKAFSGTIVERMDNLPLNQAKQTSGQPPNAQGSRPVSRFKMQRMKQGLN